MAITFHPKPGQILLCDFSVGFKQPEMVKASRPVIIITGAISGRASLATVVPLSAVVPKEVMPYHYKMRKNSMPMTGNFQEADSWVKGDMLYTVGHHRLNLIRLGRRGPNGKREYFTNRLGKEQMDSIRRCILHGLGLGNLTKFIG